VVFAFVAVWDVLFAVVVVAAAADAA